VAALDKVKVAKVTDLLARDGFVGSCADYATSWAPVDAELRHLCVERCKGHGSFDVVYPKVVIVDGAYRAGLSRCLRRVDEPGFNAQRAAAEWLSSPEGSTLAESAIGAVSRRGAEPAQFLADCLAGHGSVVAALSALANPRKWPTSFVAKYLHFHNADYVIYDGVAEAKLRSLLAEAWQPAQVSCESIRQPETYAQAYFDYLCRFAYYLEAAMTLKPDATIKELDHFLWNRTGS
jgi:hypothetical protein